MANTRVGVTPLPAAPEDEPFELAERRLAASVVVWVWVGGAGGQERRVVVAGVLKEGERREDEMTTYLKRSANSRLGRVCFDAVERRVWE